MVCSFDGTNLGQDAETDGVGLVYEMFSLLDIGREFTNTSVKKACCATVIVGDGTE